VARQFAPARAAEDKLLVMSGEHVGWIRAKRDDGRLWLACFSLAALPTRRAERSTWPIVDGKIIAEAAKHRHALYGLLARLGPIRLTGFTITFADGPARLI
jgi:hypothetical protein